MNEFNDLQVAPRAEFGNRLEALLLEELGLDADASGFEASERGSPEPDEVVAPPAAPELAVVDMSKARARRGTGLLAVAALTLVASAGLAITLSGRNAPQDRTATGTADQTSAPTLTATTPTPAPTTPTTTVAELPQLARGALAPGGYQADHFAVPFTFSTDRDWITDKSRRNVIHFITLTGPWLTVTTDIVKGGTAGDVLAAVCPGAVDFEAEQPTTLLGQPAIQMLGAVTDNCVLQLLSDDATIVDKGVVLQVTVAVVDGTVVTVMAAALSTVWPGSEANIAHFLASMKPIK